MPASLDETGRGLRFNPFAFPSDTNLRFILLFVFVIAADIRRWHGLAVISLDLGQKVQECLGGAPLIGRALLDPLKMQGCYGPLMLSYEIPAIGIGLLLLAAVTAVIYWWYPSWEIRRLRLTPLQPAEAPELFATLHELCSIAGLQRPPEFLWNPVNGSHFALAFGRAPTYRVGFTGALAVLHYTDPAAFRAVMLHELAHIRNNDVKKAYMTLALWWGFLLVALLPYLVVLASRKIDIGDAVPLTAEIMIVTGIVLLTRNAVLRARELYADARSFAWARDDAVFTRVLGGLLPIPGLRRLLSPHPDPTRRRRLLDNTDEMFRFSWWDALGAGVATSFIAMTFGLVALIGVLLSPPNSASISFLSLIIPIAIVVPLVAGAASIATWRTTFLALMRGRRPGGVVCTSCALAVGVVLGGPVFYGTIVLQAAMGGEGQEYVGHITISGSSVIAGTLGLIVVITAVLAGALAFFLKWVQASATCWLSVALYKSSPRAPFTLGIVVSCVLALAWFSLGPIVIGTTWYAQHEAGRSSALSTFWQGLITSTIFPIDAIAWVSLVAFWAFPFGAELWRLHGGTRGLAEWPFIHAAPSAFRPIEPPLRLRRALLIGAFGGLAAGVALPWLRAPLPPGALHDVGFPETTVAAALLSMTLTSMMVQGAIAALVVLAVPKLPIPHAMFAAFVAGGILTAAEALQLPTAAPMGTVVGLVLAPVVFGGALLALVASLTMSALRLPANAALARPLRGRACAIEGP
jgi:Zn-dependent protease with chaperone function